MRCAYCDKPIIGTPTVDADQESWLGWDRADKYCDDDCAANASERYWTAVRAS